MLGDTAMLRIADRVRDDLVGAGPLAPLLADPEVTDVLVNGARVWVDRGSGLHQVAVPLGSVEDVRRLAQRLIASAGRRLDDGSPYADARLPDGTRLHAVLPPVATDGPYLSLRTFRHRPFTLDELVRQGTVPRPVAPLLAAVVAARLAYLVTGGTGSGKTTLLNTLLGMVPATERIVLVEDAAELRPGHPHVVGLQARTANVEGTGVVSLADLVRQALRMRPDRLVVGECRGAEVVDLLAALNTGHDGGAGTLHANTPSDVPARLEALGMLGGLPRAALHAQVAAALQVLFQVRRSDRGRVLESVCLLLPEGPERMVTVVPAWVRGTRARARRPCPRGAAAGAWGGGAADPQRALARIGGSGMTGETMLVAALLLVAAALVAWPVRSIGPADVACWRRDGGPAVPIRMTPWCSGSGNSVARRTGRPTALAPPRPRVVRPASAFESATTAGADGRRTALGWPDRDVTRSPRLAGSGGGGSTRPAGADAPAGPSGSPTPGRHRPPGGGPHQLDAERRPGASAATATIGVERRGRGRSGRRSGAGDHRRARRPGRRLSGRRVRRGGGRRVRDRRLPRPRAHRPDRQTAGYACRRCASRDRRRACCRWSVCSAAVSGAVVGGPVAAVAMAGYGTLAVRAVLRWRVNRTRRAGPTTRAGPALRPRGGPPGRPARPARARRHGRRR